MRSCRWNRPARHRTRVILVTFRSDEDVGLVPFPSFAPKEPIMPNALLVRLQEERDKLFEFVDETLTRANDDGRDLVDAEQRNLTTSQERITELDAQIQPILAYEQTRASAVEVDRRISRAPVRTEP